MVPSSYSFSECCIGSFIHPVIFKRAAETRRIRSHPSAKNDAAEHRHTAAGIVKARTKSKSAGTMPDACKRNLLSLDF